MTFETNHEWHKNKSSRRESLENAGIILAIAIIAVVTLVIVTDNFGFPQALLNFVEAYA